MDVFGKRIVENKNLGLVNANQKEIKTYDLKKGDVLFIRSSVKREGVGEVSIVFDDLKDTVYSGFLIRFRAKNPMYLKYKKYCFSIPDIRKKILSLSTTSANTNINQESLSSIKLRLPSLHEQQKIADFLCSIDDLIKAKQNQINKAQDWKKGLMQRLFV